MSGHLDLAASNPRLRSNGSRRSNEWYTPPTVLNALPSFDLDPCSPVEPIPWSTARRHYTIRDNGLAQPWDGHVWLNPPYDDTPRWVQRLADHGDGIALLFARSETGWWFSHVWPRTSGILFLKGRVGFIPADGGQQATAHNAASPSALVAFGNWAADVLRALPLPGAFVDVEATPAVKSAATLFGAVTA